MKMKKRIAVGVDVGGTDIKCALVDEEGKILRRFKRSSKSDQSQQVILKNIIQLSAQVQKWAALHHFTILGFGFGIPGIVSREGVVFRSPHFPAWVDYPVLQELSAALKMPVQVDNDANMAARGEAWLGAAQNLDNFVLLTLGTGIGGGIVIHREVFRGDSGFGGEIGHLILNKKGYFCACGGQGCLELYASATALQKMSPYQPKKLFEKARKGDKKSRKIFETLGENLGAGIASLVNVLDIENIFLGGGLLGAWEMFSKGISRGIQKHTYPTVAERIRVHKAKLGNDAGVMGAAKMVFERNEETEL